MTRPLLATGLLLVLIKSLEVALDSQALLWFDSAAMLSNAAGAGFLPERSYVFGWLIRLIALPLHSLTPIVVMQAMMGGLTAWLLAFVLLRYLRLRPWIASLAAIAFAVDPVQVVHEHMVMTETTAILVMAVFLVTALQYLRDGRIGYLPLLGLLGAVLTSLRTVYVPVLYCIAVLLPLRHWFWPTDRKRLRLALALLVSLVSTFVFQSGYQRLTGRLAGREPAYHYRAGQMLLAAVAPIVQPTDASDDRVADAIAMQEQSGTPLSKPWLRARQMWDADGFGARLLDVFGGDVRKTDRVAADLAGSAIRHHPASFLRLTAQTYIEYWSTLTAERLRMEDGLGTTSFVEPAAVPLIRNAFGTDVRNQHTLQTPSREYHVAARYWLVFLLAAPFLAAAALWLRPVNRAGLMLLFAWDCLLMAATCCGSLEAEYRYLHPFSFTGLAAAAVLLEWWIARRSRPGAGLKPA